MLRLARQAGKGVMVGSQARAGLGAIHAALVSALPGVEHPCELSFFLKLKQDIIYPAIPIVDGLIHLADVRCSQLDEDRLRDSLVK